MNMLSQASEWLSEQRAEHCSVLVTYVYAGTAIYAYATPGVSMFQTTDANGALLSYESRDYLFRSRDLVLNDVRFTPRAGDVIYETINDVVHKHEVSAPAGEPVFRYSDTSKHSIRVHTKHVGTTAASGVPLPVGTPVPVG